MSAEENPLAYPPPPPETLKLELPQYEKDHH